MHLYTISNHNDIVTQMHSIFNTKNEKRVLFMAKYKKRPDGRYATSTIVGYTDDGKPET